MFLNEKVANRFNEFSWFSLFLFSSLGRIWLVWKRMKGDFNVWSAVWTNLFSTSIETADINKFPKPNYFSSLHFHSPFFCLLCLRKVVGMKPDRCGKLCVGCLCVSLNTVLSCLNIWLAAFVYVSFKNFINIPVYIVQSSIY